MDYTYQPPPERVVKPSMLPIPILDFHVTLTSVVACFYVKPHIAGKKPEDNYYRAIYLMQRTLKDLVNGIAMKSNIEATKVLRTIRVNKAGIEILMDDEGVTELPEGQDMVAELIEMHPDEPMRREWEPATAAIQVDGDIDIAHTVQSHGYELRLVY